MTKSGFFTSILYKRKARAKSFILVFSLTMSMMYPLIIDDYVLAKESSSTDTSVNALIPEENMFNVITHKYKGKSLVTTVLVNVGDNVSMSDIFFEHFELTAYHINQVTKQVDCICSMVPMMAFPTLGGYIYVNSGSFVYASFKTNIVRRPDSWKAAPKDPSFATGADEIRSEIDDGFFDYPAEEFTYKLTYRPDNLQLPMILYQQNVIVDYDEYQSRLSSDLLVVPETRNNKPIEVSSAKTSEQCDSEDNSSLPVFDPYIQLVDNIDEVTAKSCDTRSKVKYNMIIKKRCIKKIKIYFAEGVRVKYHSYNKKIAQVNKTGYVRGVKAGFTKISVKTNNYIKVLRVKVKK